MIIDVILREVYGDNNRPSDYNNNREIYQLPENLKRFFEAINKNKNINA